VKQGQTTAGSDNKHITDAFLAGLANIAHGTLFVPRTRLEIGKRAFVVAAPAAWNSLPDDVWSVPTLDKFKQCLKTHLFIQSYYS